MKKIERPCSVCGKESAEHQRNSDGTYLHDGCASVVIREEGWDRPVNVLPSSGQEEAKP